MHLSSKPIFTVSETERTLIRGAFKKTANDLKTEVATLKEWLQNQTYLPEIPDDRVIEAFHLTTKCRLDATKTIIENYYGIRSEFPELFRNIHPKSEHMQRIFNTVPCLPLPQLDTDQYRLCLIKMLNSDVQDFDPYRFIGNVVNVHEIRLVEDYCKGEVYIVDLDGATMAHLMKVTPSLLIKIRSLMERGFKHRVAGLHILNPPVFMDILMSMLKTLLPTKIAQRVHLHYNLDSLYEFVPKDLLPKDYQGHLGTIADLQDIYRAKFDEYEARFDKLETLCINESLRPDNLQNDNNFGFYGNFKQLQVD